MELAVATISRTPAVAGEDRFDGRFRLGRTLGRGASSSVLVATDEVTGETVALKRLFGHVDHAVLRRECANLRSVDHPRVVRLRELGRTPKGESYLVMDLVQGRPLNEALDGADEAAVIRLFLSLLDALDAVHAAGLVHGDLKPENVMAVQAKDGGLDAYILDLGLAAASGKSDLRGSPAYMAPEIIQQRPVDARADLYSVGCMLFEVLTGRVPFDGATTHAVMSAHLSTPVPAIDPVRGAVHPVLVDVTRRLLAKSQDQRFQTATEVVAALFDVAGEEARGRRFESLGQLPLVPRPELQRLVGERALFAAEGEGGAVLLEGPAGSGKTRLLDELRHELRLEGHAAPFVSVRADDSRPLGFLHDVAELLYREAAAAGMTVPRSTMALLREGQAKDAALSETSHTEWIQRVGEAAVRLMTRASAVRTVLLFIDGAEDAPEGLMAPLRALCAAARQHRTLIVVAAAPDSPAGRVMRELPHGTVSLSSVDPLTEDESVALVERVLGPQAEAPALARRIVQDSSGLPRAIEERLRALIEARHVVRAPGGWALAATAPAIDALPLPSSSDLDSMLLARLRLLDTGDLEVLAASSLLGSGATPRVVGRLLGKAAADVAQSVATLAQRRLAVVTEDTDAFGVPPHVGRVALEAVDAVRLGSWRRTLAAGLKMQRERGGASAAAIEQEVRLWLACGEAARAAELAPMAARALAAEQAPVRALALLDEAVQHTGRAPDVELLLATLCADTGDLDRAIEIYERMTAGMHPSAQVLRRYGEVLGQRGELLRAEEQLLRAVAAGTGLEPDESFELCNAVAWNRMMRGAFPEALRYAEQALSAAHETGLASPVIRALRTTANIHWQKGDWSAAEAPAREAAAQAEAAGDARGLAEATLVLATCARFSGRGAEAQRGYEEALRQFDELGLATRVGKCFNNLGVVGYIQGRWSDAIRHWESALQVCERTGDLQEQVALANNLGVLYRDQGDLERSAASTQRGLVVAERVGLERMVAALLGNLGETQLRAGRVTHAVRALDRAAAIARSLGAKDELAECARRLAEAELRSGSYDEAARMAREAAAACEALGAKAEAAGALCVLAAALRSTEQLEEARAAIDEAAQTAKDAGDPFAAAHVELERAHLLVAQGRMQPAITALDTAEETYRKMGARWHLDQVAALRSRTSGPTGPAARSGALTGGAERLVALGARLATIEGTDEMLAAVLNEVLDATNAERGFVILVDDGLRPVRKAVEDRTNQAKTGEDARCSQTATDEVLNSGRPVVVTNIDLDERYNKQASIMALDLRSITCLPLKIGSRILGVLYVDSRMIGGPQTTVQLPLLEAMAAQSAIAIQSALLMERDRERVDLVSTIAHELKSPLTGIVGYMGLLQLEDDLSDDARESVDFVVSEAERLGRTITNIMDLARMDRNSTTWSMAQLDVPMLLDTAVRSLHPMAATKKLKLSWEVDEDMMAVFASGDRIAQVLTNLITNALKFTPEGGSVTVRAHVIDVRPERSSGGFELGPRIKERNRLSSETGYAVQFDVVDTGAGIAPENQARIFQRFSQASSGVTGRSGLGLGLSIAREIVHRHNGRIWLSSELGTGSVFSFTLPAIEV